MSNDGWSADSFLGDSPSVALADQILRLGLPLGIAFSLLVSIPTWQWPLELKWAGLAIGAFSALLALGVRIRSEGVGFLDLADGIALLLCAWLIVGLAWSPDRLGGVDTVVKAFCFMSIVIAMRHSSDDGLPWVLAQVIVGAMILAVFAHLFDLLPWGGFYNPNYITEPVLIAIPMAFSFGVMKGFPLARHVGWVAGTGFLAYLFLFNPSKIELAVLPAMIVAVALYSITSARVRILVIGALSVSMAILVMQSWHSGFAGLGHGFRASILPRVEMTTNTLAMWADRPILGQGSGAFSALYPDYQSRHQQLIPFDVSSDFRNKMTYLEASHNDPAQFLATTGTVGVLLTGVAILLALRRSITTTIPSMVGGVMVAGVAANSLIDYPLQIASTLLLTAVGVGLWLRCAAASRPNTDGRATIRNVAAVFLVALGLGVLFWGARIAMAHSTFSESVRVRGANPQRGFELALAATSAYPMSGYLRTDLMAALTLWNVRERRGVLPPEEQDRVFYASISAGLHTVTLISRLEYLINTGQDATRRDEVDRWRTYLKGNAAHVPEVWMLDAFYAMKYRERETAEASFARFLEMGGEALQPLVVRMIREEMAAQSGIKANTNKGASHRP